MTRARQERKVVTVLFADLVGFTSRAERLDPEDVVEILEPYHERLRSELERFGGSVEKFIGDAVMAVFGAPKAHEDDPERAVRAALVIRDWAQDEGGIEVRMAVNTGEALVNLDARPERGEALIAGDVVNTAARLQAAAPVNGILVGAQTYRSTERAIEYRDVGAIEAKGKTEPVPVWEALAPRARLGIDVQRETRTELIGRGSELDLLADALARTRRERAPQLVTLVGLPGIGKSRLALELLRLVDADEELILWRQGRSLPYGGGVAYWALAEIAKAQAGILETDDAVRTEGKLKQTVADAVEDAGEAEWITGHLRPLVGLGGASALEDRRADAFAAWRRFFEGLAERNPVVLVFEDLHWADDGLLDFVDYLVDWASGIPLLVVCTARPELLDRRPGWGGGKRNAITRSLGPLSAEETARLVQVLLERAVLPAEVQAELLARAEGSPLYAEEYVRMLVARGSAEAGLPPPETLQGLIAARLDALPSEEKELIQDAAVVGKVFWAGALAAMGGKPRELELRLHSLERKEFVRRERRSSVDGETQHAFLHLLVRDVAYGQIPRGRRSEKHARVAEWLEDLSPDRSEDRAEMLAHHYVAALEFARAAAGEPPPELRERARHALAEAGDRAASLHASSAAARFYAAALELWPPDDPARPALLYRRAAAAHVAGEAELAEIVEARDALLTAGEVELAAEAETLLAFAWWVRGERDRALEHLEHAVALVRERGATPAKARVLAERSRAAMLLDDQDESIATGLEAIALAKDLELDELRASALVNVGSARMIGGGDRRGIADLEEGISIAEGLGSPEAIRGCGNLASVLANLGDLRAAWEWHARGLRIARRVGQPEPIRWLESEHVYECYARGRWDEAAAIYDRLLAEVDAGQPYFMEVVLRCVRGSILLARGDRQGALAEATKALAFVHAAEAEEPQLLYPAHAFAARAALAVGDRGQALALVDDVLAAWKKRGGSFPAGEWLVEFAVVADELGRPDAVEQVAATARAHTDWLEPALALTHGEPERAAELYVRIGILPAEADARLRAADAFISAGRRTEGDRQLRAALGFFRSVGATAYERAAEALLPASA